MEAKIGDKIRIIELSDLYVGKDYTGKEGYVTLIDSIGQLHGTWGGLALIPGIDKFIIL